MNSEAPASQKPTERGSTRATGWIAQGFFTRPTAFPEEWRQELTDAGSRVNGERMYSQFCVWTRWWGTRQLVGRVARAVEDAIGRDGPDATFGITVTVDADRESYSDSGDFLEHVTSGALARGSISLRSRNDTVAVEVDIVRRRRVTPIAERRFRRRLSREDAVLAQELTSLTPSPFRDKERVASGVYLRVTAPDLGGAQNNWRRVLEVGDTIIKALERGRPPGGRIPHHWTTEDPPVFQTGGLAFLPTNDV